MESATLRRDVRAALVPLGTEVTLLAGETAYIAQALGDGYTLVVNRNTFRLRGQDADALGLKPAICESAPRSAPATASELESLAWAALRTCYDPEVPVNLVDLGLVYGCRVVPLPESHRYQLEVKLTLTAPGCGMGPHIEADVRRKLLNLPGVEEAVIELVWDPPWSQAMMSEAAQLQLGLL